MDSDARLTNQGEVMEVTSPPDKHWIVTVGFPNTYLSIRLAITTLPNGSAREARTAAQDQLDELQQLQATAQHERLRITDVREWGA